MKKFKFVTIIYMLVLLVATTLSGCKGGKNDKDADSTSDSNISGEPTYGGSVVVGIQQDLDSLDPHLAVAAGTKEVLFNIYEGLVKPDSEGNLVPAVASDFEISDDAMTYTFTLRDGVTFHNGDVVTVDDVKYSIDRCAGLLEGETKALESAFSIIDSVNIIDEKTIEVKLSEPNSELIAFFTAAIIPKDSAENDSICGTGPFKFVSYSPQESFVIEKYDGYWSEENAAYLDKVEFKIVANTDSAFMELKSGTIDVYPYLTDDQAMQLEGEMNIAVGNMNLVQALFINNAQEPFDDIKVRQAICYALDKDSINQMVAGGRGHEIGSNMFSGFEKYFVEDLNDVYSYNVEKAKELLADAGYPDGFEMTITVPSNYQFHMDTAQVIVEQLKEVGINATIEPVEWASWLSDVYVGREYQTTIIGLDATLAPSDILYRYQSDNDKNFTNYSNSDFDEIFTEAIATTDEELKVTDYKKLQEILTEDAASAYIMDPPLLVALNKELGGYTFYPVYVMDMSKVYYKK